jgi:ribosomal protein S1
VKLMSLSQLPHVGDVVTAHVTRVVPFGALVDTAGGVPGLLVTDAPPAVGTRLDVRVETVDTVKHRMRVAAV